MPLIAADKDDMEDTELELHDDYYRLRDKLRILNEKSRELGFKNPDLVAASLNLSDFTSVKYAANERSISTLIEFQDALSGIASLSEEQKIAVVILLEANYSEAFFVGELVGKEKAQYESS